MERGQTTNLLAVNSHAECSKRPRDIISLIHQWRGSTSHVSFPAINCDEGRPRYRTRHNPCDVQLLRIHYFTVILYNAPENASLATGEQSADLYSELIDVQINCASYRLTCCAYRSLFTPPLRLPEKKKKMKKLINRRFTRIAETLPKYMDAEWIPRVFSRRRS